MMEEFKSSVSRLVRIFKKSRDQWKQRASEKQKKIRSLEIRVRDLSQSRDKWKQRAKASERELRKIEREQESSAEISGSSEGEPVFRPTAEASDLLPPANHRYPLFVIWLAIHLVTYALSSIRGSEKIFELFAKYFDIPTPSFDIIRKWIFRVGMYELTADHEFRSDRIIIIDHTAELGQAKCLIILGISAEQVRRTGPGLKHEDVEVLAIEIMNSCTGEMINPKLVGLSESIGTPMQIISDHGPDLYKGIRLFAEKNTDVICTYDITHKMASLLRHELEKDERFIDFTAQCSGTAAQIRQTDLFFLAPPKPQTKSRYMNIDTYVEWAGNVLSYCKRGDFSLISTPGVLDISAPAETLNYKEAVSRLPSPASEDTNNKSSVSEVIQCVGGEVSGRVGKTVLGTADTGRDRFIEKLGWLVEYEEDISVYSQMLRLVHTAEKQVKNEGLNCKSERTFEENANEIIISSERVRNFKKKVTEFLAEEGAQIPDAQTLPGTSDIIESVIGKYKNFSAKNSLKEIGKMILTLPLFTGRAKDTGVIRKALETVSYKDVEEWAKKIFGQSTRSKRTEAFNPKRDNNKTAESDNQNIPSPIPFDNQSCEFEKWISFALDISLNLTELGDTNFA